MLNRIQINTSGTGLEMIILSIGLMVLAGWGVDCSKRPLNDRGEEKMNAKTIEQVLKAHTDEWMSIPGVVGTAIGELKGKPCIKVLVAKKTKALTQKIPAQTEGFPVVIEEVGEIRALKKG